MQQEKGHVRALKPKAPFCITSVALQVCVDGDGRGLFVVCKCNYHIKLFKLFLHL